MPRQADRRFESSVENVTIGSGDFVRVVTETGTTYDIDANMAACGILATVTRRSAPERSEPLETVIEDTIFAAKPDGAHSQTYRVVKGLPLILVGLDSESFTRVDHLTSRVVAILPAEE